MYETALVLHSILRWAVLLVGLHAFWRAFSGWMGGRARGAGDRLAGLMFTIAADLQLTLGVLLWLVWSPQVQQARKDFGAAMRDSELRFWGVEHGSLMLLAIVLVHVGKIAGKKARGDKAANRRSAILYGLALAVMIVGTPWPITSHSRPWLRFGG